MRKKTKGSRRDYSSLLYPLRVATLWINQSIISHDKSEGTTSLYNATSTLIFIVTFLGDRIISHDEREGVILHER